MKRTLIAWGALAVALVLLYSPRAAAQFGDTLKGEIIDIQGKPFADLEVQVKGESGQNITVKTDKNGTFTLGHLSPGLYTVLIHNPQVNYMGQVQVRSDTENKIVVNFKEIAAKQGINVEAIKQKEEQEKQFTNMKAHFDAGIAAMTEAGTLKAQIASTPADQRAPMKEKLGGLYQTAVTELETAERGAEAGKDKNLPVIQANLGTAYEATGEYDKAAKEFEKAIDLKPMQAGYYIGWGTNLARAGKMQEAGAACDKAAAIDPANAGVCWRNVGIVLRLDNKMKEAVAPLQKATQVDPKNPDGWYLLGASLLAAMDYKQEGEKITYIVQPGTAEAYQKYLELAPTGPHAQEAKEALDSLVALGQGVETKVSTRKKKG
jgi:tetratricopeptide (TPR) repeat protein